MRPGSTTRLAIAALLFVAGLAVYLSISDAPLRVHLVFVAGHAVFLFLVSFVAWGVQASRGKRLFLLVLVVLVMAPISALTSSLVIRKVEFHLLYVVVDFIALAVEGALFLGVTWGVDLGFRAARNRFARAEP